MNYFLEKLPYSYDALEPYIDAKTMELHHKKHHFGYAEKLESVLENDPSLKNNDLEYFLMHLDEVREELRRSFINFGGGVYNHNLFWKNMAPPHLGVKRPEGALKDAINKNFGSYENWWEEFKKAANGIFGSGWAWLVKDKEKNLKIISTPNQDSPLSYGYYPLLGLDVWEHAYYLKYQNRRNEYIEMWQNVIDWQEAMSRFEKDF